MTIIRKTVTGNGGGMEFVLSDETPDRMGDIISADGWILTNFKRNPIALFGHSGSFPIGTWSNVRVEPGKLVARLNLAARGTSQRIDELISLVEQGILRAVSVGFMPLKAEPIDEKRPFDGMRFLRQELLETSLVSVPANPSALQLAKSMNLSDETMSLVFGEHAGVRRRDMTQPGEHADTKNAAGSRPSGRPSLPKGKTMTTLSQRIEAAQNDIIAKRDTLTELTNADDFDVEAVEELNTQIDAQERGLAALKSSEAKLGMNAQRETGGTTQAPAVNRRPLGFPQKEVNGFDLIVRAVTVRGIAHFGPGDKSIDRILDERYPGHEATAIVTKADQVVGTTVGSHWADDLVRTAYGDFMQALTGFSIYPALRDRGIGLSFNGNGTVTVPSRTAGGAGGGFFAEGSPIRVGRITTASVDVTAFQMGVIVAFTRKLAQQSTPAIEALVRQGILEDTSAVLDPLMLDAVAADSARPAGLLNGVSAAASSFGGGDYLAVIEDFKALLAPFIAANAADNITVVMNPAQGLSLSLLPAPIGNPNWFTAISNRINIVESTHATAGRLIALRNSDFVTATGDAPQFDVSEQATIHMEDTTPLEIVSGSGPTTADPVRSLWQTGSVGIRMIMDISWRMRRTGMVQWIDSVSW